MFYIDSEYKCHATNPNGEYRAIDKELFNGMSDTFIEGYRYIPEGESWTRSDGVTFKGEMVAPWKPYNELDTAQREYEREKLTECTEALQVLGVEV